MMRWPVLHTALAGSTPDPDPPPPPPAGTVTVGIQRYGTTPHQLFHPTSYINLPRPADDALLVDSINDSAIAELVSESNLGARPAVQTIQWSMPTYTVDTDVPRVPVKIHTQPVPNYQKALQQILLDPGVRIPATHVNQGDSDDECCVYSPTDDIAWEWWRLRPIAPQDYTFNQMLPTGVLADVTYHNVSWECTNFWQQAHVATHFGRSRNLNLGTYPNTPADPAKRLYYEDTNMSTAAARIPFSGTNLTEEDVIRGRVDHLLSLSVVYPQPTVKWWPASTTDGFKAGSPLAEGMRFFFPQTITIPSSLHPVAQLIMQGVRDYGLVILDKSGSLEIDGEPRVHNYFGGTAPSAILNGFPWGSLKLMAQLNADGTALSNASPFPH